MNNPSPLIPQGSFLEQKIKSRARVRLAVFFVISIHVVGLMALLISGCRKPQETEAPPPQVDNTPPPQMEVSNTPVVDTNPPPVTNEAPPVIEQPVIPQAPANQEYTVAPGDSFYTIAKKFPGVTTKQIQDANPNVQPTRLKIGQKLQIPPAASLPAASPNGTAQTMSANGELTYKVKSGDYLIKIATDHGTTVKALRSLNNLSTDTIKVGEVLKIPAKATPPTPPTGVEAAPAPAPQTPPGTAPNGN